jgi:hypothetical protein
MKATNFVLMAEAAALAFMATITNLFGLQEVSFLPFI